MKKLITKALLEIFLLGMAFTLVLNLGIQVFLAERNFKELSEGYFYQIDTLIAQDEEGLQHISVAEVFEMLPPIQKTAFYIVNAESYKILCSTNKEYIGEQIHDIGINVSNVTEKVSGRYYTINGQRVYCAALRADSFIYLHSCSRTELFRGIFLDAVLLGIYISTIFFLLLIVCYSFLDRRIIRSIHHINTQLKEIESGSYDVRLNDDYIEELSELSHSINTMTRGLLDFTKKVSKALELSRVPIGICEYNRERNLFLSTSRVKSMLMLTEEEYQYILLHPDMVENLKEEFFIADSNEGKHVYRLKKNKGHYIRVESFPYDRSTMVVLIDVTEEIGEKKFLTKERDTDMMTRLYNARAGYRILGELFEKPEIRKTGLLFMIDLDHLKFVNDKYGHEGGDRYIETFAEAMHSCPLSHKVVSRMGGDEFLLFAYGYESEEEAEEAIEWVDSIRDTQSVFMENGDEILLEYSIGYAFCPEEETEIRQLVKLADRRMYENKKERKSGR